MIRALSCIPVDFAITVTHAQLENALQAGVIGLVVGLAFSWLMGPRW